MLLRVEDAALRVLPELRRAVLFFASLRFAVVERLAALFFAPRRAEAFAGARRRPVVFFAVIFFLGFEALAIYLFVMNRRLTSELVSHSWKQPTVLLSSSGSRTIATLYGVDWRITPPISIRSLPEYIPNA